MIYILSWTTKKHHKTLSRSLDLKLKKIQALFEDLHRISRTFQDCANPVNHFVQTDVRSLMSRFMKVQGKTTFENE